MTILDIGTHVSTLLLCLLLPFLITFEEEEKETVVYLGGESVFFRTVLMIFSRRLALRHSPRNFATGNCSIFDALFDGFALEGYLHDADSVWMLEPL